MGYLNLNKGYLEDFEIQIVNEDGCNVLYVIIRTDKNSVKYRITTDERQPNLNQIQTDFTNGLTLAKDTEGVVDIGEYLERKYIFVTFPNTTDIKQYTASKVQI